MATLTAAEINDLVAGTLKKFRVNKLAQIATTLQEYEVMGKWLKRDRIKVGDGYAYQGTLLYKTLGAAKHTGLHETDNVNIGDHLVNYSVPWRHATTDWGFEHREVLMNRGKSLVNNIIKPRRIAAMIDMAKLLEDSAWSSPAVGDDLEPFGVPHWVVKDAVTGFNGGHPGNHTDIAGIDVAVQTTFQNYTHQYTNVTKDDLIAAMRTAFRKICFKSPVSLEAFRGAPGKRYRIYVNEATISSIETLGEQQNENLGRDVASMDDEIVFRKIPFKWIPKLDDDTQNPVYMIDNAVFYPVVLKGDAFRESPPKTVPGQHNSSQVFVDLSYNYFCEDRRKNAVLATA